MPDETNDIRQGKSLTETNQEYKNLKPTVDSQMMLQFIKKNGIYNPTSLDRYHRFARFSKMDPYNRVGVTKEYIFFTKPDLQIFLHDKDFTIGRNGRNDMSKTFIESVASNPLFIEAATKYPEVLHQLCYSQNRSEPFINLLSNQKVSNVDLPAISVSNDYETSRNILGSSVFYRGTSIESDENHEFSVEFLDTKYLEVYMFFKLFDEYSRLKHFGRINQPNKSYAMQRIIHDQMSMYKFIVSEDSGGEDIIYWAKYVGVYPKTVPRDVFSDMADGSDLRFTVSFKSTFVFDMEVDTLHEFNRLCSLYSGGDTTGGGYIDELEGWSGDWMQAPYIAGLNGEGQGQYKFYKLKWKAPNDSFKFTDRNPKDQAGTQKNLQEYARYREKYNV